MMEDKKLRDSVLECGSPLPLFGPLRLARVQKRQRAGAVQNLAEDRPAGFQILQTV